MATQVLCKPVLIAYNKHIHTAYRVSYMECPYCRKELSLPPYGEYNARAYRKAVNVATLCCGQAIRLTPITTVSVNMVENPGNTDDWGTPYKQKVERKVKT